MDFGYKTNRLFAFILDHVAVVMSRGIWNVIWGNTHIGNVICTDQEGWSWKWSDKVFWQIGPWFVTDASKPAMSRQPDGTWVVMEDYGPTLRVAGLLIEWLGGGMIWDSKLLTISWREPDSHYDGWDGKRIFGGDGPLFGAYGYYDDYPRALRVFVILGLITLFYHGKPN